MPERVSAGVWLTVAAVTFVVVFALLALGDAAGADVCPSHHDHCTTTSTTVPTTVPETTTTSTTVPPTTVPTTTTTAPENTPEAPPAPPVRVQPRFTG